MTSWSATMSPALLLKCVLATWLFVAVGAITVSIDRADVKAPPTRSSMIANGWRPLTNSYEETIGTNVSPSSHLEKNVQVHPVLSKFQEHMATSEKLKPPRKGKPPIHEYSPPSILGSFSVFGHAATKARGETKAPIKHVASETREYTFLIPPPKDAYRFEVNQHRKPVLRDNTNYLRQPQPYVAAQPAAGVHQQHLEPVRAGTYFIKGFATSNRPYVPPYAMPQALQPQALQPPRSQQAKPFESLKVGGNGKPYFQPPVADVPGEFGNKQKAGNDRDAYDNRYQVVTHNAQILSSASSGNFYSQINHPPSHFKSTYERDPAFLVHESHEVSYVTPPGTYNGYNFRPSLPYETLLPPAVYTSSSTSAPSTTAVTRNPGQYSQTSEPTTREHDFKRTDQSTRNKQDKTGHTEPPNSRTTSTYYVSEHQELTPPSTWPKNKYTSDINEVLPRENPPTKFSQEVDNQNQIVYRRPHNPYEPVEVYPPTTVSYETPESISLKHFNEQQFLLQQQLLQRDRERLAEQERQQKLEIERQQQEELKKRQQELNQLFQQEKEEEEAARLAAESAKNQSQELVKITGDMPYTIQLAQFEPQVTTGSSILISQSGVYNVEPLRVQSQVPENQVNYPYQQHFQNEYQEQQVDYRDPQTETRPYRPQKPSRDPHRRKKPLTVAYDITPTEPPSQPVDTSVPLTLHAEEVPVQTTVAPESQTVSAVTTQKPRVRRPGSSHRRRKPSTTTQEPVTVSHQGEDFLKYNRGGEEVQANHYDSTRRRRIKPTQVSYTDDDTGTDKRTNSRKRPSHRTRVNHLSESFDAEAVTENAHSSLSSHGHATEAVTGYNNENNPFATNQPSASYGTGPAEEQYSITNQPINQYYDYTSQLSEGYRENHHEDTTAPSGVQVEYYGTELSRDKAEDYNVDSRQQNPSIVTNIPLEELYVRTDDGNYYDRATTVAPTTTTTTTATTTTTTTTTSTTTTTPQPTTQNVVSSTLRSHKTRPLRYGNATRPRFSIKDYKSRLDYKTRLQLQSSTTELAPTPAAEASTRAPYTKHRTSSARNQQQTQQPATAAEPVRETTGRYKYVSRMNYRTTTSAAPTAAAREHEQFPEEGASSTTEKSNRFVPKRRPISSNVYRSRIASTTSSPTRSQLNSGESSVRQSSARPENVYSSSIRRRPVAKSRPHHPHKETVAAAAAGSAERRRQQESTEMAAEETSFYSAISTTAATTTHLVGNEIVSEKGEAVDGDLVKLGVQENEGNRPETIISTSAPKDEKGEQELARVQLPVETSGDRYGESQVQLKAPATSDDDGGKVSRKEVETESTTKFDVSSDEEELFAKASQSVADLTSSASALYDKPGMFKAVSPESRVVPSAHFKITTDEPTLPIEAFFQEFTKKN